MTVENCIRRYKEFTDKDSPKYNSKAAEDMKQHMLKAKKFRDHPFLKELEPKAEPKPKKEKKEDGKKPKRRTF